MKCRLLMALWLVMGSGLVLAADGLPEGIVGTEMRNEVYVYGTSAVDGNGSRKFEKQIEAAKKNASTLIGKQIRKEDLLIPDAIIADANGDWVALPNGTLVSVSYYRANVEIRKLNTAAEWISAIDTIDGVGVSKICKVWE